LRHVHRQTNEPCVADEMSSRREHACHCSCRRTAYIIKAEMYWHTVGRSLNLFWEFRRFDADKVDTQFFNFRDKFLPSHNTHNFQVARFRNRDQA